MAHFAELDENNIVLRVIVVDDAHEADGENWCNNFADGAWKQTSYNSNIRYNYAGIGDTYDTVADAYYAPEPYPSWSLDAVYKWQPPVAYPEGDDLYHWDESSLSWKL
jgi:hypothetical protein